MKKDARELLKVKELSTVVIKGKAKRDADGNLTVLANGVYVYQIEWAAEAVSRDPETAPRDTLPKRIAGKFVLMD